MILDTSEWTVRERHMPEAIFMEALPKFGMGELKYMFQLIQKKQMILYFGPQLAGFYKRALNERIKHRKERGPGYEVWR